MGKYNQEKINKKEADKEMDYLKQVDDLPESKSRKFGIDNLKEEENQKKKRKDKIKGWVNSKSRVEYKVKLAAYLQDELSKLDFPKGWEYKALSTQHAKTVVIYKKTYDTQDGILVVMRDAQKQVWVKGVGINGDIHIDMSNMDKMAIFAEDVIDESKGLLGGAGDPNITKSGIHLTK